VNRKSEVKDWRRDPFSLVAGGLAVARERLKIDQPNSQTGGI